MPQNDSSFTGEVVGLAAIIQPFFFLVAPLLAPLYFALANLYGITTEEWHWHPLFSIIFCAVTVAIFAMILGVLLLLLPRMLIAVVGIVYFASTYFYAFRQFLELDYIWSSAAALVAAAIGCALTWKLGTMVQTFKAHALERSSAEVAGETG